MSLQPPDLRHQDPVIQRLLDWLKSKLLATVDDLLTRVSVLEATREIRGVVSVAGAVAEGTGFTASRTSLGLYTVTFTDAFTATPIIVTQSHTAGGVRVASISARAAGSFSIEMRNDAAGLADSAFGFLARGAA